MTSSVRALQILAMLVLAPSLGAQVKSDRWDQEQLKDLPEPLRIAIRNYPKLRYSGTRVIEFRQGADRKRHTEVVLRDGPRIRIEFPGDSPFAGQVIVESKGERRHFFPDRNEIYVTRARRDEAFFRLFHLLLKRRGPSLKASAAEGETIAGQRTQRVEVTDPAGNPLQKMWIHPVNGMILKREMFDRVGTRVGYFEFTSVDFTPNFASDEFQLRRKGARMVTPYDTLRHEAQAAGLMPLALPKRSGYSLEHVRLVRPAGQVVLVQSYVGKRERLTLFQLKGELDEGRLKRFGRGLNVHEWRVGGLSLALVGDLPVEALRKLAASIR